MHGPMLSITKENDLLNSGVPKVEKEYENPYMTLKINFRLRVLKCVTKVWVSRDVSHLILTV